MIQRIQSVFLLLIALCMIAFLFLPIWSKTDAETGVTATLTAFSLTQTAAAGTETASTSTSTIALTILAIMAAAVALYEIFQYKNRLTQMKLGMLNTLLLAALLGTSVYYAYYVGEEMIKGVPGEREAAFYLPFLALLLNALANRFIRRDEQLVRSVDRLR
ncbi:DUF4293 domain-containing protein [Adhaeribacter sp. BT258]|uniref:DUF4293 domain-containing protein n=1 Tax=Adhaeribacter terrigena TaxID=2793070 RepID=A0ABS1C4J0_9BACT|nr:DUF4293 domain-containing protein [Adhaeribacter terrigena]MBK0403445.1 DUF4293 domain-containing protein [Adhaeribacter terrigena]